MLVLSRLLLLGPLNEPSSEEPMLLGQKIKKNELVFEGMLL